MADEWRPNDPTVDPETRLLRKIPVRPGYYVARDSINGRPYATPKALQIDVGSGLSAHGVDLLASEHQVDRDSYCPDDYVIEFSAGVVRALEDPWGVVFEEDPQDLQYGKAHALVRYSTPRPSKSRREDVREAINRACTWVRAPESAGAANED